MRPGLVDGVPGYHAALPIPAIEVAMHVNSERLVLRPAAHADTEDLLRIYGDPETNRLNPEGPLPDLAHAKQVMAAWLAHWRAHGFGYWAIATRDAPDRLIGFGGIRVRDFQGQPINNLGYHFALESWGHGYATEFAACALACAFGPAQPDRASGGLAQLETVTALVRDNHLASQRVLEKVGFQWHARHVDPTNPPPLLVYRFTRAIWKATDATGSPA